MEKEFIPYELALKLKELGFDEECLAGYIRLRGSNSWELAFYKDRIINFNRTSNLYVSAPLWQQAFDWFREKYSLHTEIRSYTAERFTFVIQELKNTVNYIEYGGINNIFKTYKEARQDCLEKLIELCKKK